MSLFATISTIATIVPDKIGFFGYFWEVIGNFFVWIGMFLLNAFYQVCKWFLALVDFLQYFIQKLIGLDYWLSSGSKSIQGATESDLLFSFLYNETVQNVFRALVGLFVVFLIIFTIFAIVKQEWQFATGSKGASDNSKTTILRSSLKAIALVMIVPILLILGVVSSNAILASIVKALNVDMSTTFGNTIFSISSISANRYRIYTDSGNRTPVSSDVTFYINDDGKQILFGSIDNSDDFSVTYSDLTVYLKEISTAKKYTVDTMFQLVNPSKETRFYGYCIRLNLDGTNAYYMVKVNEGSQSATTGQKEGMFYYLKNILKADILNTSNAYGNSELRNGLKGSMSTIGKDKCFIEKFNIDNCSNDEIFDACYNTWSYASIYRTQTQFNLSTSAIRLSDSVFNKLSLDGISSAKLMINDYDYANYFDNGQLGFVAMNAEYGVMTDVIDFICETGANLYVLDATSSLIDWKYEGYEVGGRWVAEIEETATAPTIYDADGDSATDNDQYMSFVVDYSEKAISHEQGKTLYLAKTNEGNELTGSKFIMCWKVSDENGMRYVPLINRKTFLDKETEKTYTFKSEFLSNEYNGVVFAKGTFDATTKTSVDVANGAPTYMKMGANLDDGDNAIEYDNEPYYFDISAGLTLTQRAELKKGPSTVSMADLSALFTNVVFDNSEYSNYQLEFDSADKTKFRFVNASTNEYLDVSEHLINKLTLRANDDVAGLSYSFKYLGVNDGKNYIFATSSGYLMAVGVVDNKTLSVYNVVDNNSGVGVIGQIALVPYDIDSTDRSKATLSSTRYYYLGTLTYNDVDVTYEINPSNLEYVSTSGGTSLFSTEDKVYVEIGNSDIIRQNMVLSFYFNDSSIYNIDATTGNVVLAAPSSSTFDLQMYKVSLYDFMTAYVSGDKVYKFDQSKLNAANKTDAAVAVTENDIIETYMFGVFVDDFDWESNETEYNVYNGSQLVAKLIKAKGATFDISNISGDVSKTIAIEVNGSRYLNVRTQNKFVDVEELVNKYEIINKSMFIGCYHDRIETEGAWDFSLQADFWNNRFFSKVGLSFPIMDKNYLLKSDFNEGIFSLSNGIAFDYFFEGDNSVMQFYNVYKIAYWIILISAVLIIKTLGTALWGVIRRFYEITLYYLALPVVASTMPLDGGSKFGNVQGSLIKQVLSTYGVILGINLFFILLAPIKSMSNIFTDAEMAASSSYFLKNFPFNAKILNNYVYILFVLVAFSMIESLIQMVTTIVGGDDVHKKGNDTKTQVGKAMKESTDMISGRAAMDFGKKTLDTISTLPMMEVAKKGIGFIKNRKDDIMTRVRGGQSSVQDDADAEAGASASGGNSQSSSRADGSSETPSGGGSNIEAENEQIDMNDSNQNDGNEENGLNSRQADEVRGIVDEMIDSESGEEEGAGEDENNEADPSVEAENSYNEEAKQKVVKNMSEEDKQETRAETVRDMAKNGNNGDVVADIANNIVGDNKTLTADNAAAMGLTQEQVIALIRQILGEQAEGMSDEDIAKNYELNLDKDLTGNLTAAITDKSGANPVTTELSDEQTANLQSEIVANASTNKISQAYENLDENEQGDVDVAMNSSISSASFDFGEDGKLESANMDALKLMELHKGDEDVENAVILEKMKNSGLLEAFRAESGLSEDATDEEILATIAKMKNLDEANAAKLTLENMSGSLDNDYAKVIANMVKSGEIKASAWDLATDSEKEEYILNKRAQDRQLTEEEKEVEKDLMMKATDEYQQNDASGFASDVMNQFTKLAENGNIENASEIKTQLILNSLNLNDKSNQEYKDIIDELKTFKIDFAALAKQGYSEKDIVAAYAEMRVINGGKVENLDQASMLEALKDESYSDTAIDMLSKDESTRIKMADMLMNGTENEAALLTSDNQGMIKESIAEEKFNNIDFWDIHNESQKRQQADELYETQGSIITADIINQYKEKYDNVGVELQNELVGSIISKNGLSNTIRDRKVYADLMRQLTGKEDLSDNNANNHYFVAVEKDDQGNYSYSLKQKDDNGKIRRVSQLDENQVKLVQDTLINNINYDKFDENKVNAAFENLSKESQDKLKNIDSQDLGAAMKTAFVQPDSLVEKWDGYDALLGQINEMRQNNGQEAVTTITDSDLQALINNEDNLGEIPIELENLRKEIIRAKIDSGENFSSMADASKLTGKEKDDFEYKKLIIEEQANGENGDEVLANLFNNSNFVGKDELLQIINNILKSMGVDDPAKASQEQMNKAISEALKGKDDVKDTLISIGATDITKAISNDNLFEKQKDAIINDAVLARQFEQQLRDISNKEAFKEKISIIEADPELMKKLSLAGIKKEDADYEQKLEAFLNDKKNKDFADNVNKKFDETTFNKQKSIIESDSELTSQLAAAGINKTDADYEQKLDKFLKDEKNKDFVNNINAQIDKEYLFAEQKAIIESDAKLMSKLKVAGINKTDADYEQKLSKFLKNKNNEDFVNDVNLKVVTSNSKNASFNDRLNNKIQAMIDPSTQVSDEDKQRFFQTKSQVQSDIVGAGTSIANSIKNGYGKLVNIKNTFNEFVNSNAKDPNAGLVSRFGSAVFNKAKSTASDVMLKGKTKIYNFAAENDGDPTKMAAALVKTAFVKVAKSGAAQSIVYKVTKALPKESKKYDEWNALIDKDIEAVKSGKGAYKDFSKEERRAKLEELKAKKIDTQLPTDYYNWSNEEQTTYMLKQNELKNEAFNTNISKVKKNQERMNKTKDKNVVLKFADQLGYSMGKVPVLRAISSRFASDELKQKHEQDLMLAEANINRYKSSEPMRNKSVDFGKGFDSFAKGYLSDSAINKIKNKLKKDGIDENDNSEKAIKAREEAFAREINKQYKVASAKVARDQGVKPDSFLVEKGINAGSVRYKDGTAKYRQVESRLNLHIPGVNAIVNKVLTEKRKHDIDKYEEEYASTGGHVSEKTRRAYQNSYYGKRSEAAAIRSQNEAKSQQKLYDEMLEFNKTFKGSSAKYEAEFKARFGKAGQELYEKYNKKLNLRTIGSKATALNMKLENSPTIVQQRELLKQLEREMKKNFNRQKYASAYIPASELAKHRFSAESLSNKKTSASVDMDRQLAAQYNQALKEFMTNKNNANFDISKLLGQISPSIKNQFESKFNSFKNSIAGFDNMTSEQKKAYFQKFLENNLNKYNKRVYNNSFTPRQVENLTKLNGMYVDRSKVNSSRISPTVLRSLSATDADVYKNLVKNVNKARSSVNAETINLENLKKALNQVQTGIQNNAAKEQAEKIKQAIRNSEIKLNNLKGLLGSQEERKKAFEQAIASERIKTAVKANAEKSKPSDNENDYKVAFKGPNGKTTYDELSAQQKRQVRKIMDEFTGKYKADLDYLKNSLANRSESELRTLVNKAVSKIETKFISNYRNLVDTQKAIEKKLKTLIDKKDKKSKQERDDLKIAQSKLSDTLKEFKEKLVAMGIEI